ncbi:translation initiation factor 2 [Limoniibacter endophyticus]|uniref:Translation initiation factor 2 n=1 Tax=Limoniibacter endophyticus TaxID=1565040 RepID=A0A8J3GIP9_9HYPH|nr:translation initiation factor 2 [Limoniibacter endophyticus]GHC78935.1 hypothetical protein GCM10010136_31060 [Limoniibacter endophyticus]
MHKIIFFSVSLLALTGCGTITRGANEPVRIESEPSGARVTTDIGLSCPKTPCVLKVPRNKAFTATGKLGDKTGSVRVETVATGNGNVALAGNVVAGGVIGLGVDAATGANKDHKPNPAIIVLK